MNVEYIHYLVDPAKLDAFVGALRSALSLLDREPTVLYHELVQDSDEPGRLVVRIEWQTRESQRAYLRSGDYARFIALVKPFQAAFVSMRFHDPLIASARRSPGA